MIARFIALVATLCISVPAFGAYNYRPDVKSLRYDLSHPDRVRLAWDANRTIDGIVRVGVWKLHREGFDDEADRIEAEWYGRFEGLLPFLVEHVPEGIGEHAPLSIWLGDVYATLDELLGKTVMEALHLDDLNIVNFAIPVVFHLDTVSNEEINVFEYRDHFLPFSGVLAYWLVWSGCQLGTAGTGWFIVCTPAGMAAEFITATFVAPRFSDGAYHYFYD